jgi:hypothetical protein
VHLEITLRCFWHEADYFLIESSFNPLESELDDLSLSDLAWLTEDPLC